MHMLVHNVDQTFPELWTTCDDWVTLFVVKIATGRLDLGAKDGQHSVLKCKSVVIN